TNTVLKKTLSIITYSIKFNLYIKPPPTPSPGDGKCLPRWVPYGRFCYHVYNGKEGFSWNDARHHCQSLRTELASIHSRAEVEFIRNLNYTKHHNIWIGLARDRNFGWGWTDKTSLGFLNWAQGEPNSAFHPGDIGEENCVEMYLDGRWNDNNCLQKRGFACRHRQCKASLIHFENVRVRVSLNVMGLTVSV
uniref:C-type lectin domain-containing protein n=1 Tax=Fundulus heteroclitus TaxID=8078 RepID=A0A3Q2ST11_FUNHE